MVCVEAGCLGIEALILMLSCTWVRVWGLI